MLKINVLSNDEFENLPKSVTRGSDISGSMGFADPATGTAYVRHSVSHDLNKFLVNHEMEELLVSESTHEDENGIRHKKFKDFVKHFFFPPSILSDNAKKNEQKKADKESQALALQQQRQSELQTSMNSQLGGLFGGQWGSESTRAPAVENSSVAGNVGSSLTQGLGQQGLGNLSADQLMRSKGWLGPTQY